MKEFYEKMSSEFFESNEKFVIGYVKNEPVTIGILFINGNNAGIFNLIIKEEDRKKGCESDMVNFLIKPEKDYGCNSITLSASGRSGYLIYKNLGFCKIGVFECFEYSRIST